MDEKLKAGIITAGLSLIPIGTKMLDIEEPNTKLIGLGVIVVGAGLVGGGIYCFISQMNQKIQKIFDRFKPE